MPVLAQADPEIIDIFVYRALTSPDSRWLLSGNQGGGWSASDLTAAQAGAVVIMGQCGNRVSMDVAAKPDGQFPRVIWSSKEDKDGLLAFMTPGQFTARQRRLVTVFRQDFFINTQGDYNQARTTVLALGNCLLGSRKTPVFATSGLLGYVTASEYRTEHRMSYVDPESKGRTTELGFVVAITYEPNTN